MEAYISSIKYIKVNKFYGYFKVTLLDKEGNLIGYFGNEELSSPEAFRIETFGILTACNCFDLLRLGGEEIKPLEVWMKYDFRREKVLYIKNNNGITLDTDDLFYQTNKEIFHKFRKNKNEKKVKIKKIVSESGTYIMYLYGEHCRTCFVPGNLYYGFGYPLTFKKNEVNAEGYLRTVLQYFFYIKNILKFYRTDDLMTLNRKRPSIYRKVSILLDENDEIYAIGNEETNMYLVIKEGKYEIIHEEKEKIKSLIKTK